MESLFLTLCDVLNDLDREVLRLEPAVQERFTAIMQRLDEVIDSTIGLEQSPDHEEEEGVNPGDLVSP